jgi:3'-phosphoadenosine 5'-phosphosulfate sulfotransferase (PAPS reductase)/FAD synthetase
MDALAPAFVPADDATAPADIETRPAPSLTHLEQLEAESVHIIREAVAESENPVMLYSIGKDSSVLLHLALKAFYPAKPPFPLLHVDTTWKFREMIAFRDARARELGIDLIVHVNQDGLARGINPVTSGSELHTDVMKTQALRQALDHYRFDAAFGGARRDEEKSRAKERVFSFRNANHLGIPNASAPSPGESITAESAAVKASAYSRCRIGPSSTFGSTSIRSAFRWCRCISPRRVRSSNATVRSSWWTTSACRWLRASARRSRPCGFARSAALR